MSRTPTRSAFIKFSRNLTAMYCATLLVGCGSSGGTPAEPGPPAASLTLTASATTITSGGTITLTWSGSQVSNCVASNGWTGARPASGTEVVGPLTVNANFALTCDASSGALSKTVAITVTSGSGGGPQLKYATYIGGLSDETIRDVAVGPDGSVYITGGSDSSNFPVQNGYDTTYNGVHDVVVAKFTPAGALVWSTFIGGPNYDRAYALEVDNNGDVYIAGRAGAGFPTTAGVVQQGFNGDTSPNPAYGPQDGFVTKLSTTGQLIWSTYLGGDDLSFIRDIAIDSSGNIYFGLSQVSTTNNSISHLITANSFQTTHAGGTDGIIGRLRSDGAVVQWGTFLGGSNNDNTNPSIRLDQLGNVLVAGITNSPDMPTTPGSGTSYGGQSDMHITKFLPDGSDIVYAAYMGGSSNDAAETHNLAVDSLGNAFVASATSSADFPVTNGAFSTTMGGGWDAFVTKFSPQGVLLASTYFGGSGADAVEGISIGPNDDVFITGLTDSIDFPLSGDALQSQLAGQSDIYAARLTNDLSTLVFSTYLGGSTYDLGRSSWIAGEVLRIVGHSNSNNFPVTNNAFDPSLNGNPNTGNSFTGDGLLIEIDFAQP